MDLRIHDKIDITLADLGQAGCLKYVFNDAAKQRLDELLDCIAHPPFNQDEVVAWAKKPNPAYGARKYSPVDIALNHPVLYRKMMTDIERQINAGHTCA